MSVLYAKAQEDCEEQTRVCDTIRGEISRWQDVAAREKDVAAREKEDNERLRHEIGKLGRDNNVAVDMVKKLREKYEQLEDL